MAKGFLVGLTSSFLLLLCYFPVAWGWLAWIALVPMLALVRLPLSGKALFGIAYCCGLAFFVPVLQWMRVADYRMYATWLMLAFYCAFYFPAALLLIRRLDRRGWPLVVAVPTIWVGLEFIRSFALTGFAWYYLGHSQHRWLGMIQSADLAGVYAISFLIAAVNAWLFELAWRSDRLRQWLGVTQPAIPTRLGWQAFLLIALLIGNLVYGEIRLSEDRFDQGPRLALLQGNLDQRIRNDATQATGAQLHDMIYRHYKELCDSTRKTSPGPDLVVWPETSFPYQWSVFADDISKIPDREIDYSVLVAKLVRRFANDYGAWQLLGVNVNEFDEANHRIGFNSALLFNPPGNKQARYDKIHRVPFGEYVPMKDWIPFMNSLAPYDFDYSIQQGKKLTRFEMGPFRFGVLICYEDSDPFLARNYGVATDDGKPVDFLINISNDGWFDGTSEHEEHLAVSRFRAIEARRAVARAVNMGISAIIDSNGRVLRPEAMPFEEKNRFWLIPSGKRNVPELPVSEWGAFKKQAGVVLADVPIDRRVSLYARWGDWFPIGCLTIAALGLLAPMGRRKSR